MRVPQVNERVKEAPAQALRAIFAGIGQLLSASDKIRSKAATAKAQAPAGPKTVTPETITPETITPETAAAETAAAETAVPETAVPETVTPETVTPETVTPEAKKAPSARKAPAAKKAPAARKAPANAGGHVRVLPADEKPETPAATPATPAAAAPAELPVPNYDELTVASLRARLRNLTTEQVTQLLTYEQSHAARADVISMYERRIAKLAAG